MSTHYETLGVPPDASASAIREAYVRLAKAHHPDRRQSDDAARAALAEAAMKEANAAWWVLRDAERRAAYDARLRGPTASPTTSARPASAARPAPSTSGVVVPAAQASFFRFVPVVVIVVVLAAILVFSAVESAKDAPQPSGPAPTVPRFEVGSCVLVAALPSGPSPVQVACGTGGSSEVAAVVATPRPCPPDTAALALDDNRTTLCLRRAR